MQIVIDISNYNLDDIKNGSIACSQILKAVKNGTVLPKGHGDLIDRDVVYAEFNNADLSRGEMIGKLLVFGIQAVIPADK